MSAESSRGSALESVTRAVVAFLRRFPPFDATEEEVLQFLASRLTMSYYGKDEVILAPEHGEPACLYIVQAGVVRVAPSEPYHLPSGRDGTLGPGECFSVGALVERRAVGAQYFAATDVFCYQLPAADFQPLLDRSPRLREFATRYLSSLLRESRRLLKMSHASSTLEHHAMNRTLRSLIRRTPVSCAAGTATGEALRTMQREGVGSIVVVGDGGVPEGIFTRYDVLDRVALPGRDLAEPISTIMTPVPRTLPAEATAHDAALLIARHGLRHVPVVDAGRLIGVVTERDLFALQRASMRGINETIAQAQDIGVLQQAALDIRSLARDMVGQGVAPEPLTAILSGLNDALTARVVELEVHRHALDGIGWEWLAFGSEGRYEQTISTDQDNGIIFQPLAGQSADRVRERLLPFAQAVNRALDACGYPLCRGGIMAGNAQWCLSLDEWMDRFAGWIANTDPQALLGAAIFFDFRAIHGGEELAGALRERVLGLAAGTPRFLRQLAEQGVAVRPPLGVLTDFVTGRAPGPEGTLDLKQSGARLFVDAARVLALATGTVHTSTAQRLRQAGSKLGMRGDEVGSFVEGFEFIQMLRLRCQCSALEGKACAGGNRIRPDALNEVDRRILKECFRQARKLQARLALDYQL